MNEGEKEEFSGVEIIEIFFVEIRLKTGQSQNRRVNLAWSQLKSLG
jgi:hypothetical protein